MSRAFSWDLRSQGDGQIEADEAQERRGQVVEPSCHQAELIEPARLAPTPNPCHRVLQSGFFRRGNRSPTKSCKSTRSALRSRAVVSAVTHRGRSPRELFCRRPETTRKSFPRPRPAAPRLRSLADATLGARAAREQPELHARPHLGERSDYDRDGTALPYRGYAQSHSLGSLVVAGDPFFRRGSKPPRDRTRSRLYEGLAL